MGFRISGPRGFLSECSPMRVRWTIGEEAALWWATRAEAKAMLAKVGCERAQCRVVCAKVRG